MWHRNSWNVVIAAALLSTTACTGSTKVTAAEPEPKAVARITIEQLRMGGYVLYMRHTSKDQSKTEEKDREDFDNCSWQNDLTEIGRGEAKQLGEIFSELGIPIADVLSSPYCRCINTARLAFGQSVKRVAALRSTDGVSSNEKMKGLQDELDRLLNTPPPTGKNTVIVGHSTNLKKVTGILPEEAPEGSTTIFLPHPGSQWQCFQTILLKGWKIEK